MKLNMCVYLCIKFQVSSIILMSFRQGAVLQIRISMLTSYFFCQFLARILVSRRFHGFLLSYSVQSIKVGLLSQIKSVFVILYVAIVNRKPSSEKANPRS